MSEDKESKTELPSQKRFAEAAEKGNTPFSREIPVFASTLAIYIYLLFYLPSGVAHLWETLRDLFEKPDQWRFENGQDIVALLMRLGWESTAIIVPAFILMGTFGIGASIFQNLPSLILDRIEPKFSRLNIIQGFQRIFGLPGLVEFGKSLFKVVVVGIIVTLALRGEFISSIDAMYADPNFLLTRLTSDVKVILIIMIFATAAVGVADHARLRFPRGLAAIT